MGNRRRLLYPLGILLIGLISIISINYFVGISPEANRAALRAEMMDLARLSQKYYRESKESAGGGHSFKGWKIPEAIETTSNGAFSATIAAQSVILTGTGNKKGNNGSQPVKITVIVSPTAVTGVLIDN